MTDDIIERAETLIRDAPVGHRLCNWHFRVAVLFPSLVAELKAARAEVERLKARLAEYAADQRRAGFRHQPG